MAKRITQAMLEGCSEEALMVFRWVMKGVALHAIAGPLRENSKIGVSFCHGMAEDWCEAEDFHFRAVGFGDLVGSFGGETKSKQKSLS